MHYASESIWIFEFETTELELNLKTAPEIKQVDLVYSVNTTNTLLPAPTP